MEAKQNWLTISEDGTVNIPADLLVKYGLKSGDEIGVVATKNGMFLGRREQIVEQILDQLGESMREQYADLSEDEMVQKLMERGRDNIRPRLLKELYGIYIDT